MPNPIDWLVDKFKKDEETSILQEYGGDTPENPTAIAMHMPSYAAMWKLGGGISTAGGFATKKSLFGEKSIVDSEEFNPEVEEAVGRGSVVAYGFPTGEETYRGKKLYKDFDIEEHRKDFVGPREEHWGALGMYTPYIEKEDDPGAAPVDTIFHAMPILDKDTGETSMYDFGDTGWHEMIHYKQKIGHPEWEEGDEDKSKTGQGQYNIQTDMMRYTADMLLEETDLSSNDLWRQISEGKDITNLIPKDIYEDKVIDGKTHTWEQRIVSKAEKRLVKILRKLEDNPEISKWAYSGEADAYRNIIRRYKAKDTTNLEDGIIDDMTKNVDLFKADTQ